MIEDHLTLIQEQIDELAAKMEGLDSHHKARLQEHDRIIGKVSDATDKMGNVLNKLTGTDWYAEPTPSAALEPDDDARWEAVIAVAKGYLVEPHNEVLAVKAAVAEAVRQGLTPPADRAVVVPEMPEDVKQVYLNRRIDGSWRASTSSTTDNRHYADKIKLIGTGPTIPAAIANALEGAAK